MRKLKLIGLAFAVSSLSSAVSAEDFRFAPGETVTAETMNHILGNMRGGLAKDANSISGAWRCITFKRDGQYNEAVEHLNESSENACETDPQNSSYVSSQSIVTFDGGNKTWSYTGNNHPLSCKPLSYSSDDQGYVQMPREVTNEVVDDEGQVSFETVTQNVSVEAVVHSEVEITAIRKSVWAPKDRAGSTSAHKIAKACCVLGSLDVEFIY